MSTTITPAPIRKSVHVDVAPARAFAIFTAGMARWWLKTHTINPTKARIKEIVLEPRDGGRWYERGVDGSECNWGKVLAWEPPARVLLAWQINADFKYDPTVLTEVEIRFAPDGGGTRVELEHRNLERLGERAPAMVEAFTNGWGKLLDSFAQQA